MNVMIRVENKHPKLIESASVIDDVQGMVKVEGEHVEYRKYSYYCNWYVPIHGSYNPHSSFPKSWPRVNNTHTYRTWWTLFLGKKTAVKSVPTKDHVEKIIYDPKFARSYHPDKLEFFY